MTFGRCSRDRSCLSTASAWKMCRKLMLPGTKVKRIGLSQYVIIVNHWIFELYLYRWCSSTLKIPLMGKNYHLGSASAFWWGLAAGPGGLGFASLWDNGWAAEHCGGATSTREGALPGMKWFAIGLWLWLLSLTIATLDHQFEIIWGLLTDT